MADFVEYENEAALSFREKGGQSAQCKLCKMKLKSVGGSTKGVHKHLKRVKEVTVLKRKIADDDNCDCKTVILTAYCLLHECYLVDLAILDISTDCKLQKLCFCMNKVFVLYVFGASC